MWIWGIWFAGCMVAFAILELSAKLLDKPAVFPLLSRTIWQIQAKYPIFGCVLCFIAGGLTVHFFGWIPPCHL